MTESRAVKLGLAAWAVLVAGSLAGRIVLDPIVRVFLLAPWVIVPLGWGVAFPAGKPPPLRAAAALQPWAAASATAAFFVPPGRAAGLLSAAWVLTTGLGAWAALARFLSRKKIISAETVAEAGLLNLFVGSLWLAASRLGLEPMGFKEPIVILTAVHFHFTGFAAAVFTAALGRHLKAAGTPGRRLFPLLAAGVILAMPAVGAGFVFSPLLKVAAVVALCAVLIGVAALTLLSLGAVPDPLGRGLLGVAGLSLLAGMVLAALFGGGEYVRRPWLDVLKLVHTHGLLNGLGFSFCGLLGWRLSKVKEDGHGTD